MVEYAVLYTVDASILYSVIVSANTMVILCSTIVNNSTQLYIIKGNTHMSINKHSIELDTEGSLIDNLNSVESLLRDIGVLSSTDNLLVITDNNIGENSITIRDDVTLTALGNQISVMPNADVTVDNTKEDL